MSTEVMVEGSLYFAFSASMRPAILAPLTCVVLRYTGGQSRHFDRSVGLNILLRIKQSLVGVGCVHGVISHLMHF